VSEEDAGLQGSGEARLVLTGDEIARAVELFSEKFPTALGASTMNISFFRIAPTDVKLVDESYGGGRGETRMFSGAEYRVEHVYNVVRDLPATDFGVIAGKLAHTDVGEGEVVARQGAPADKFLIVVEGELAVTREGGEQVTTLGPGDFFGEVAALRDTPRSATLTATKPSKLLAMDREDFRSVVAQSLGTVADFDRIVAERLGGEAP
jgi:CRP-like cAMP-binding protein